ncbi:unnamed protein product, partial [Mesorhabditis belari]|uniref:Uncharacterized protein n=1 Tax=Mesorhabditis belari TaxID=2138241 RepID=A0AAF3FU49_9BILA
MLLLGCVQIDFIQRPRFILNDPPIIFEIIFFTHLLAIISIHSKRPFFIQLYLKICLWFAGLGLLFTAGEATLALMTDHNRDFDGRAIVVMLLTLAFFGIPWIWQMLLTYSYYQWIRDERLKVEELMNLSSPFSISIEKGDLSFSGSLLQQSQQNRVAQHSNETFRQIGSSLAKDPEAQTPQNFHRLTFKHTDWLPGPNLRLDLYNSLFPIDELGY